jgi:hypothetical protein
MLITANDSALPLVALTMGVHVIRTQARLSCQAVQLGEAVLLNNSALTMGVHVIVPRKKQYSENAARC